MTNEFQPRVVFISGPPQSGKDTVRMLLEGHRTIQALYDVAIWRMSAPLKAIVSAMIGLDKDHFMELDGRQKDDKELFPALRGMSIRDAQIKMYRAVAEVLGEDWLGYVIARDICAMNASYANYVNSLRDEDNVGGLSRILQGSSMKTPLIILPDAGRESEVMRVTGAVGIDRSLHVKMERPGKTYVGDSREEWEIPEMRTIDVNNDGAIEDLYDIVRNIIVPAIVAMYD